MAAVKKVTTRKLQVFSYAGSYFVILPREWVRRLSLDRGALLNIIEEEDGRLVITSQAYEFFCKFLEFLQEIASKPPEGSPSSPTETGKEGAEQEDHSPPKDTPPEQGREETPPSSTETERVGESGNQKPDGSRVVLRLLRMGPNGPVYRLRR